MDLDRRIRKVERELGVPVSLRAAGVDVALALFVDDKEQSGQQFSQDLGTESCWERNLKALHERVYRERSREVFRRQRGLCAICSEPMQGTENTECDHRVTRAHGRDDRIENLRVCCSRCHRKRHGG